MVGAFAEPLQQDIAEIERQWKSARGLSFAGTAREVVEVSRHNRWKKVAQRKAVTRGCSSKRLLMVMTNRLRSVFWLTVASQLYQCSVVQEHGRCLPSPVRDILDSICDRVNGMGRVQQPESKPARKGSHSLLKGPKTDDLKKNKTGKLTSLKNKIRSVERLLRKVCIGKVF